MHLAWPSSAGDGPRYHKREGGGLSGCAPDEPVRACYVTTLTVNIYQAGRPPPTHQRIVTLGWLSVEQKSRPKRSGRGASEREDRLKIPKWSTPLRSWNRLEEGRIHSQCCPHQWKFPFCRLSNRGSYDRFLKLLILRPDLFDR